MNHGHYEEIKRHFLRIRGLDPSARHEAIAALDEPTRERVLELLSHDEPDDPEADADAPVIPGYQILDVIGEGGFGIVYRALQLEPVRREVAIKRLKAGMDSRAVVSRFESERQTLARMSHPGIARVFDAGTTSAGLPYFVMELVEGPPITRFVQEHGLDLDARLRLMARVCDAVHDAHTKGVMHRDLKPGNILVQQHADGPAPKVIDFGIAKALAPGDDLGPMTTQGMIGTPAYMAPEQADPAYGAPDTRTDIYALGAVLYELISGVPPLDPASIQRGTPLSIARALSSHTPLRPSTQLQQQHSEAAPRDATPRRLRGDLNWIALKCLEREPGRRYESAAALAADIRRHLTNRPIEAGPPSALYRISKFVRRHRAPVVATAAIALLLIASAVTTTLLAIGQARARSRADTEAIEAMRQQTISGTLTDILLNDVIRAADPEVSADPDMTIREAFLLVADRLEGRFATEPEVRAGIDLFLGRTLLGLGEVDRARVHLERAADLTRDFAGADSPELLGALTGVARSLHKLGRREQGVAVQERVLEGYLRTVGPDHEFTLDTLNNLGFHYLGLGRLADARDALERSLDGRERTVGRDTVDATYAMNNLAIVYERLGQFDLAAPLHREALRIRERELGPEHPLTMSLRAAAAADYSRDGRHDEAIQEALRLLTFRRDHFPAGHANILSTASLLGSIYMTAERYDDAEPLLREAMEGRIALFTLYHRVALRSVCQLGRLLVLTGRAPEAIGLLTPAMGAASDAMTPDDPELAALQAALASALARDGQIESAIEQYELALACYNRGLPPGHSSCRHVLERLVELCEQAGRPAEAGRWQQELAAAEAAGRTHAADDPDPLP
ncbi:MAG: serine/threonine protein kinase [Phycisphaeraceae bacterium]|nr:serine/threonine protein kinase [Phycisphaeraceae bacterium]